MPETSKFQEVEEHVKILRQTFASKCTLSYQWRYQQLQALQRLVTEGRTVLCEALTQDLHKSEAEGFVTEVGLIQNEVQEHLDHLSDWMSPEKVGTDLLNIPGSSVIQRDPLGVACIIGAWNYPVQLTLLPLVGCLAAGNCAVVRVPSDQYSSSSSRAMAQLIKQYMDPSVVRCVEGNREATQAVLAQRFDIIFFTGGSYVGKMVAKAAAEHLTPTVLELGGKSPCIIDQSADLHVAAKRATWGAFMNAGQTCVRPDYVMVHESLADQFLGLVQQNIASFYGKNAQETEWFGRVINARAHERIRKLIEGNKKYIVYGGQVDATDKYVQPTIMDFGTDMNAFSKSTVMQDELFAPIMPIYRYRDISEVIDFVNQGHKPLALYCFANSSHIRDRVLKETSSGGAVVNDCIVHLSNSNLPFGGVGNSGMGSYHGKASFDVFSHKKSILYKTSYLDLPQRYPPYTPMSIAILNMVLAPRPRSTMRMIKFIFFLIVLLVLKMSMPPHEDIKAKLMELAMKFM